MRVEPLFGVRQSPGEGEDFPPKGALDLWSANAAVSESALRTVLRVSKCDLNQMLAEEKKAKEGKPKPGPKPQSRATARSRNAAPVGRSSF